LFRALPVGVSFGVWRAGVKGGERWEGKEGIVTDGVGDAGEEAACALLALILLIIVLCGIGDMLLFSLCLPLVVVLGRIGDVLV
jgi:hypothetical protein